MGKEWKFSPKSALLFAILNTTRTFAKVSLSRKSAYLLNSSSTESCLWMTSHVDGCPGSVCVREGGPRAHEAARCEVQRQTMNKCYLAVPGFGHHSDPAAWKLAEWSGWRDAKGRPA